VDQRSHPLPFQTHNRNHSQVKAENVTPPLSTSFPSQAPNNTYSSGNYSTPYAMETSTPHPPIQSHLNTQPIVMKTSLSTPSTPLSFGPGNAALSPSSNLASVVAHGPHYYSHDQAMVVDTPKRRPAGFRHVRSAHDLRPKLDAPTSARRMAQDGTYLSVCFITLLNHAIDTYVST
jgi:dual specificity protein kinase YAK1